MPLSTVTVTGSWVDADNTPATGLVTFQPVLPASGGNAIVAGVPIPVSLVAGAISKALVNNAQVTNLQYQVTERIDNAPINTYVITPTGSTLDLSTAPRGGALTPQYILASTIGAANGIVPLDGTSHIPSQYLPSGSGVLSVTALDGTVTIGGTAANPTVGVNAIPESKVTGLAGDLAAVNAAVATKATKSVIRQGYVLTGDINPLPNTAAAWQALAGFELQLPAAVGDYVELSVNAMRKDAIGNSWLDMGVFVGSAPGSIVRYLSTGGGTPGFEGDPGWYVPAGGIIGRSDPRGFTVTPGDLDGGNVRFVIAVKSNGTGILYASNNYPFFWRAINRGVVG